jgi:hypothetical protein
LKIKKRRRNYNEKRLILILILFYFILFLIIKLHNFIFFNFFSNFLFNQKKTLTLIQYNIFIFVLFIINTSLLGYLMYYPNSMMS